MNALKIGEVSKRSEVGIEALRYYERLGLLGSPRRTESGYRLYHESIFARLDFIRKAQAMGFTLVWQSMKRERAWPKKLNLKEEWSLCMPTSRRRFCR